MTTLLTTELGATPLIGRGKVRDLYAIGDDLLLVATDRISAFDHVLGTGIPGKGKILTQISLFWFDLLKPLVPNHLITAEVSEFPASLHPYADQLRGRSMLVKRAAMFPVECVARGYLTGSGLKEYKARGTVCGIPLPAGLLDGSRLPEPLYTPSTKGEAGTPRREHKLRRHRKGCGRGRCRRTEAAYPGHLQASGRACRVARPHPRRYQVRVRQNARWNYSCRRSVDAGFFAILGCGDVEARRPAAFVRQTVRARLS